MSKLFFQLSTRRINTNKVDLSETKSVRSNTSSSFPRFGPVHYRKMETDSPRLVIDEGIVEISSDEEVENSIFHPMSITSADLQAELFHEEDDTNTCSICDESFRYNIALICHMEMEHVAAGKKEHMQAVVSKKSVSKVKVKTVKKKNVVMVKPKTVTPTVPPDTNKSSLFCECCKKKFGDQRKRIKHQEGLKLTCMFCKLKFCWESKYKKHLHKKHKLNAVVICRLCSQVFDDMTQLACHSRICPNRVPASESSSESADELSIVDDADNPLNT